MSNGHHLDLHDRGLAHRHRWQPRCSCGWLGVQRRRQREAVQQFHAHRDGEALTRAQKPHGGALVGPRPLTAFDDLPELLR